MKRRLKFLPTFCLATFTALLFILAVVLIVKFGKVKPLPVKYSDVVERVSVEENVPEHIIYAVIHVESKFVPDAISSVGAMGLMQLLPSTAQWLVEREGGEFDESLITDPEFNIKYGTKYLKILYDRYKNWDAAHAAYHAGFSRVDSWLEEGTAYYNSEGQLVGIPIDSTKAYVNKLRDVREQYFKQLERDKEEKTNE